MELRKRIWGVLAGVALGDAMGMPTECWSQEKIKKVFPNGIHQLYPADENDTFGRSLKAGAITDDTINTLMILKMMKKNQGRVQVEDYIKELIEWNETSGVSSYVSGPSTLRALEKISNGVPVSETGIMGTTNGAAMKIAPIGIISDYRDMKQLVENVYQICLPTHNTKIAIAGASAVAAAISYVVRGGTAMDEIWRIAYKAIRVSQKYGYDFPSASLSLRMQKAQNILVQENYEPTSVLKRLYEEIGTGMETIETIPSVFAIVELAEGKPWEAAQLCAMLGWDTDTIGSISCAICGGMNPVFPQKEIQQIEKENQLSFENLASEMITYLSI